MNLSLLHYVHDPMCGWCYAAAPMIDAVQRTEVVITLHGGGLWEPATQLDVEKRSYIRQSDLRIAALAQRPFGEAYLGGLLNDERTIFWSRPTIAAVIAAGILRVHADLMMLDVIQDAHYQEGLHVVDEEILANLAVRIGLNKDAFCLALHAAPVDQHIDETQRFMRQFALRGFPGFVLEHDGKYVPLPHENFYGNPDAFVRAVQVASKRLSS